MEHGETSRRAVVREFAEELDLHVEAVRRLGAVRLPDAGYILAVWQVAHCAGEIRPAPAEISAAKWVSIADVEFVAPGLPSNGLVVRLLAGPGSKD